MCTRATPPLVVPQQNVFALLFDLAFSHCIPILMVHCCYANAMGPWCFTRTKRPSATAKYECIPGFPARIANVSSHGLNKAVAVVRVVDGQRLLFLRLAVCTHARPDR